MSRIISARCWSTKIFHPNPHSRKQSHPQKTAKTRGNKQPEQKLTSEQERIFTNWRAKTWINFNTRHHWSGKTEIYTHLAKEYLEQGQQVLILSQESLTPQIIEYFENPWF